MYAIVALSIAFFQFRRGGSVLVSTAVECLPWRVLRGLGPAVNVLAVIATAFGVAASLGMGALQVNSGLHAVFGLPVGGASQVGIIVVTTALFLASAVTGVTRGIKWLSGFNLVVAALLALAVFVMGPTIAIIDAFTNTLGSDLSDFVRMSLRMTPFRDSGWISGWTVFYWAWWVSWSSFVGLFIARVSRGCTIREFVVGTVLAPSLAAFVWFSVVGGTALNIQIMQGLPLSEEVNAGLLVSGIAIGLPLAGGVKAVQTATIVFALPFTWVIVLMAMALWRGVRHDWHEEQQRDKALRRRMREFVEHPPQGPAAR